MSSHGYLLPNRGVVFSSRDRVEMTAKVHSQMIRNARRAEELGFDSLWVGDSVLAKPRLEPLTTLAAVAGATDSVGLGTAVYLPNLRHPINVAHQTATLDLLSGGRLLLALGVGSRTQQSVVDEHRKMDVPFDQRGAMLDESLDIISQLWSGQSIDYDGEFYQFEDASIDMQPTRDIPLYFGSAAFHEEKGFLKHIRQRFEKHLSGWLPSMEILFPEGKTDPASYTNGFDKVKSAVDDSTRQLDGGLYQSIVIADTEAEALAEASEFYNKYYPSQDFTDEEIKSKGAFGPPDKVREHIESYEEAGVDAFVTRFDSMNQYEQLSKFMSVID